jgi:hypothetical protein
LAFRQRAAWQYFNTLLGFACVSTAPICDAFLSGFAGTPEWLSNRVLVCAIIAAGLLVLLLLLKGLQKIIAVLLAFVVVLGGYWMVEDAWLNKPGVLPPELQTELNGLAAQFLHHPGALDAWRSVQKELETLPNRARARLSSGGDEARAAIAKRLDEKAGELRRQGQKTASDQLALFRRKVSPAE